MKKGSGREKEKKWFQKQYEWKEIDGNDISVSHNIHMDSEYNSTMNTEGQRSKYWNIE